MGEGSLRWGRQAKMTLKLKPEGEAGVSHARSILGRGPSKPSGDDLVCPRICVLGAS